MNKRILGYTLSPSEFLFLIIVPGEGENETHHPAAQSLAICKHLQVFYPLQYHRRGTNYLPYFPDPRAGRGDEVIVLQPLGGTEETYSLSKGLGPRSMGNSGCIKACRVVGRGWEVIFLTHSPFLSTPSVHHLAKPQFPHL